MQQKSGNTQNMEKKQFIDRYCSQLAFHKDLDYSESVEYLSDFEVEEEKIKNILINNALKDIWK